MKLRATKTWSITARLVTIAVVPAMIMFVAISLALYFSGRGEIRSDIKNRGDLLAAALAERSQYDVVSGNTEALNELLRGLLAVDESLIAIEIVDANRARLVFVGGTKTRLSELQILEHPIRAQVPDVNVFNKAGTPHVSSSTEQNAPFRAGDAVGYVRVTVSPVQVLESKRQRFYITLVLVLGATLVSGVAGLVLAQRLRYPLSRVMSALRGIRGGNLQVDFNPTDGGELGELQRTIVNMAKGLNTKRQELEDQVAARTSDLQTALGALKQADDERIRLIAQGNALVEEERRRIAIDIHDHLNASLIFLKLQAQQIEAVAAHPVTEQDAQTIKKTAKRVADELATLYNASRNMTKHVWPEVIDTLGLKCAIQEMVRTLDAAHPDCRFVFEGDDDDDSPQLSSQLTIAAYRVVQEALSNVVKHATASHATVALSHNTTAVYITIEDNGKGFDVDSRLVSGIGLIGMRERVTAAGGSIKVISTRSAGTKINIELPAQQV